MNVNANAPVPVVSASRFGWRTRRDLLALAPVAALAGLASTGLRTRLLTKGLQFSDRMSEVIFQPSVMAQTFRDSQLTPLAQFPYNSFNCSTSLVWGPPKAVGMGEESQKRPVGFRPSLGTYLWGCG
jgi:hypothetical protein